MKELKRNLAKYTILQCSECHIPLSSRFDETCFTLAAMNNFGNADKSSWSGRMHAHDTAISLFQVQRETHVQKPPKHSLDLKNAPSLNKLPCQEIHSFHSSQSFHSVIHFKSKMSLIWTKHLKANLSLLSTAPKV